MVGVDSGPLHVAGATSTPTIGVWTRHHPLHYFALAENVTHLVPENHRELLRGNRRSETSTSGTHYRFSTYRNLAEELTAAVQERLNDTSGALVYTRNFWVRSNNAEQDLVVVKDIAEDDSYRVGGVPVARSRGRGRGGPYRLLLPEGAPALSAGPHPGHRMLPGEHPGAEEERGRLCHGRSGGRDLRAGRGLAERRLPELRDDGRKHAHEPRMLERQLQEGCVRTQPDDTGGGQYWADFRRITTLTIEDILESYAPGTDRHFEARLRRKRVLDPGEHYQPGPHPADRRRVPRPGAVFETGRRAVCRLGAAHPQGWRTGNVLAEEWSSAMTIAMEKLDTLVGAKILVVGDVILDRYTWGSADRVSPEAPVLVLHSDQHEVRPGGAASVAMLLAHLGAQVSLAGVVGRDAEASTLRGLLREIGVHVELLLPDPQRPTTVKERFLGRVANRHPHQVLRVDREVVNPLSRDFEEGLAEAIVRTLDGCQVILISDYAKGVCTPGLLRAVFTAAQNNKLPVIVDPARIGNYDRYRGASLIVPNRVETELASGVTIHTPHDALRAGRELCDRYGFRAAVIKLDADGMVLVGPQIQEHVPTRPATSAT